MVSRLDGSVHNTAGDYKPPVMTRDRIALTVRAVQRPYRLMVGKCSGPSLRSWLTSVSPPHGLRRGVDHDTSRGGPCPRQRCRPRYPDRYSPIDPTPRRWVHSDDTRARAKSQAVARVHRAPQSVLARSRRRHHFTIGSGLSGCFHHRSIVSSMSRRWKPALGHVAPTAARKLRGRPNRRNPRVTSVQSARRNDSTSERGFAPAGVTL